MVVIQNNIGQPLYSIDWDEGIVNITPKGVKFNNEANKFLKLK